jgi:glycosyltransferase involved in cell wall biosynthesis
MRIAILTNEYPPNIYGGAGVHVEYLTRELTRVEGGIHSVEILCFGDQAVQDGNLTVRGIKPERPAAITNDPRHAKFFDTMLRDLIMAGTLDDIDVVHCHTWYTHLAGCLVKQLTGARLVLTTHSLDPTAPGRSNSSAQPTTPAPGSRRPPTRTQTASLPSLNPCARTCIHSMESLTRRSASFTTEST